MNRVQLAHLDLFFWWCFTDCTMVDSSSNWPPFTGEDFWFTFSKHRRSKSKYNWNNHHSNKPGKQPLLITSINFTPKTKPQLPQGKGARVFSRMCVCPQKITSQVFPLRTPLKSTWKQHLFSVSLCLKQKSPMMREKRWPWALMVAWNHISEK